MKAPILAHAFSIGVLALVLEAAIGFHDVEQALSFYGVYHRNPINQLIHFFGVPLILWSLLLSMCHISLPGSLAFMVQIPGAPMHELTYGSIITVFYAIFYLSVDVMGGGLYLPFIYMAYISSVGIISRDRTKAKNLSTHDNNNAKTNWMGTGKPLRYAALLHAFSWYIQIHPGHAIFEGAKPAVVASVGQALAIAPLFAFYEGVWLIGINKELQQRTLQLVAEKTTELCANGVVMRVCDEMASSS